MEKQTDDLVKIKNELRSIIIKDKVNNEFKYSKQTAHWVSLKGHFDVFFTLEFDKLPARIRVLLTLEDLTKSKKVVASCPLSNGIEVENNKSRPQDIYYKEYDWTNKADLATSIRTDFLELVGEIRAELKKR
jgi:hypothetical protein